MEIMILGMGCPKCKATEAHVREAVARLGLEAEAKVTKITDIKDIMSYNVMRTPALVIDGKIVSVGRVPTEDEIEIYLKNR